MTRSSSLAAWLLAAGVAVQPAAFAAHPLQTEDTGTQGVGNIEIENGLTRAHDGNTHRFVYQPQFSYGALTTLDLIVQPSFQDGRNDDGSKYSGLGDTNLDAKWRFYGSDPWSLGVRAGVELPTASHTPGLPHETVAGHELLVLTFDQAPFTVYGNLGFAENPADGDQRRTLATASTAVLWSVSERLILTMELAIGADPEQHHEDWPATSLAGVIWTIVPGLDTDAGYQIGIQHPSTNQWLAGLTYRFAL